MSRWSLRDPATGETWVMPLSPDSMSSPHATRRLDTIPSIVQGGGRMRLRTFMTPESAVEWEWGGVIRTQAHHNALEAWARKEGEVHVSDHLGRTWAVLITSFQPTDRRPTPSTPWRLRYTMSALILRRVS